MSLFATPEEHAANPPETWEVRKSGRGWGLWPAGSDSYSALDYYSTKRDATQGKIDGSAALLWEKERRWFAGESIPNWKPYAVVKAEREKNEKWQAERKAAQLRKIERMGTTPEKMAAWRAAVAKGDLETLREAAGEMFDRLDARDLLDPELLTRAEAAELHADLNEMHDFGSSVDHWRDRIRYGGFDQDKSALEILDMMADEERQELQAATR